MKKNNLMKNLWALALLAATFAFTGCNDDDDGDAAPEQNIWEIVQERDNLSSLEAELERAGLDATLSGSGNMTLFAPSNDALTTLLGTLGLDDFSPVAESVVQAVLSYHVANSEYFSADITEGTTITTVQGEDITVVGGPRLSTGATSDAGFVTTDIEATNGVVHIVDVVLVPPSIGALIVQTLGTAAQPILLSKDFTTLSAAILKADQGKDPANTIVGALVGLDAVTFFAPPNAVLDGNLDVEGTDAATLDAIIRKHIVPSTINPMDDNVYTAIDGTTTLTTTAAPNLGTVSGPQNTQPVPVAAEGIAAGNGIVYPIGGIIQ